MDEYTGRPDEYADLYAYAYQHPRAADEYADQDQHAWAESHTHSDAFANLNPSRPNVEGLLLCQQWTNSHTCFER